MSAEFPTRSRQTRRKAASPVTVTRPDGTVEDHAAYTPAELYRIDRKASRQPRTWDEINSSKGGGTDFGRKR